MQKTISLYPKQMRFFGCNDLYTAFVGGIGSGKTYAGAVKALYHARIPGSLGMVVAPTYTMLRDVSLRAILDIGGDAVKLSKADMIVKVQGGGELLFRSADNPERLRGPNLNHVWIDEGASCPPGTFEILIGRLRAGGEAGHLWITTTPKGRNWLYRQREAMTIFHASTADNPHLAKEFIASVTANYQGEFARQELHGEFISMEGLVYAFNRDVHVRNLEHFNRYYLAIDEGYTNPCAILAIGIDGDGRHHVCEEWYETGKLQSAVVAQVRKMADDYKPFTVAVDAAAAGLIADLRDAGLPATPQKGRVIDGIQRVQNMLAVAGDGRARLTVSPECKNLINEFESYVWKDGKDEPAKENDHALDSLRYGIIAMTAERWVME